MTYFSRLRFLITYTDLDRIITQIVKPKVSVYMAIDGVAPRAKLNQQRSRRFRSAKDTAEATKDLPQNEKNVFDSNCITPGTEFLAKVSEHIQYFIRKKLKEDPLWHGLTVIFSGHDIPGEGEHKIMQHIRELRSQPGYQPNNRHCIYGQVGSLFVSFFSSPFNKVQGSHLLRCALLLHRRAKGC